MLPSCKKDANPAASFLFAQFSYTSDNCDVPCEIQFTNESINAQSFHWTFGDGAESQEENPVHIYQALGNFEVTLQVNNEDGEKSVSNTIVVGLENPELDFITGMDLSYQSFLANYPVDFKQEDGSPVNDVFQYVKDNGVNLVRLRLFHKPDNGDEVVYNSRLSEVLKLAQRVKSSGNNFLLDIHYSDTWADPNNQTVPAAWQGKPFEEVKDSVYAYTKFVLEQLQQQNTLPEIIQIGNEINSGMLWDYGKVWNEFDDNWGNLVALINSAQQAIGEIAQDAGKEIQTMIHIAGITDAHYFFDELIANGATFDIIGLSYYPWWHGNDLNAIEASLQNISIKYNKSIVIAETMYPFTLDWNDWTNNVMGSEDQLVDGFAASPQGQKEFYEALTTILKNLPNGTGKGFIWWAPDYVAFNGNQSNDGSAFENLCTFDFENKALPVMGVFREN